MHHSFWTSDPNKTPPTTKFQTSDCQTQWLLSNASNYSRYVIAVNQLLKRIHKCSRLDRSYNGTGLHFKSPLFPSSEWRQGQSHISTYCINNYFMFRRRKLGVFRNNFAFLRCFAQITIAWSIRIQIYLTLRWKSLYWVKVTIRWHLEKQIKFETERNASGELN